MSLTFHPLRDKLLAETHARPPTPIDAPMLIARIATVSGQDGATADRRHFGVLCERFGQERPSGGSRWWALDAGGWQVRWERHAEFSTWTVFRRAVEEERSALDVLPTDWLAALPGEVLVSVAIDIADQPAKGGANRPRDAIGSALMDGAATVFTDLRPGADGATHLLLDLHKADRVLAGRIALALLEIETYRLMALLAFPLATATAGEVAEIEREAGELAGGLAENLDLDDDRELMARLVALSGRAEALNHRTAFRFNAAAAYFGILKSRIASLREAPVPGMQTIGEFMERRLAPAMRTCETVAAREGAVIERIARAGAMLRTRIEVAAGVTNAGLLKSMDRRADASLRLQRTVEGLSVAAIAYYALSLLAYPAKAAEHRIAGFDATMALGIAAPFVVGAVWWAVHHIRRRLAD